MEGRGVEAGLGWCWLSRLGGAGGAPTLRIGCCTGHEAPARPHTRRRPPMPAPASQPHPTRLHFGVGRRAQQHKLAAALHGAPRRVLDQVDSLLVRQPRHHAHNRHVCVGGRGQGEGESTAGRWPGMGRDGCFLRVHPCDPGRPAHALLMRQLPRTRQPLRTRVAELHALAELRLGGRLALQHAVGGVATRQKGVLCGGAGEGVWGGARDDG